MLWLFQTVTLDRKQYCLTCFGFNLNVAPLIMKAIVSTVMLQKEAPDRMASAYINDIYANEIVVPTTHIREHWLSLG